MAPEKTSGNEPAENSLSGEPFDGADPQVAAVDSEKLLQGARELIIRHHGQIYRLRLTRNDKLILHK